LKRAVVLGSIIALAAVVLFAAAPSRSATPAAASAAAPDFALKDLDGKIVRLSDYRGKAVVLNFWATWCPPCRHEIPWFVDLQNQYGPHGLEIIGISMDESGPAAVKRFADRMNVNYKVVMGDAATAARYGGVRVLPTTVYIGRDGKVISTVPGLVSKAEIEGIIQRALSSRNQ
jgi:peroxiredoxin